MAFRPDGRLLSRDWGHLLVGREAAMSPEGYVPIHAEGPERDFLVTSSLGHVATNVGDGEFVVISSAEFDTQAPPEPYAFTRSFDVS